MKCTIIKIKDMKKFLADLDEIIQKEKDKK